MDEKVEIAFSKFLTKNHITGGGQGREQNIKSTCTLLAVAAVAVVVAAGNYHSRHSHRRTY